MEKTYLNLFIGLAAGVVITLLITNYSVNSGNYGMMQMMGMGRGVEHMMDEDDHGHDDGMMSMMHGNESMSMDNMVDRLDGISGEEFDREFVELMIEHHQGAIDMAKLIDTRSEKEELRKMGQDIINVQSAEIEMMENWLEEWSK